jgi:hypothetical protein
LNDETEAEARDPTELNLNSSKVEANAWIELNLNSSEIEPIWSNRIWFKLSPEIKV